MPSETPPAMRRVVVIVFDRRARPFQHHIVDTDTRQHAQS